MDSFPQDSQGPTPPPGGEGGAVERAEGGQGGHPVVRELWFIVVMTGIALLLLAIVLGVLLHKVSPVLPCWGFFIVGKTAADDWRLLASCARP